MVEAVILTLAYILDRVIGDPAWLPHPVSWIGWGIEKMENILINKEPRTQNLEPRHKKNKEKASGVFLAVVVVGITYGLFYIINMLFYDYEFSRLITFLLFIGILYLTSTTLATGGLIRSARSVLREMEDGNIERARKRLSHIVGRDTGAMESKEIQKAAIETLAENASDGIVAPLFYFAIGGLPLAMAYKAINTLDSMVGYKNEKYQNFGWASAKLDDIANFIPARLTGILIVIAAFILETLRNLKSGSNSLNGLNAFRIMLRDGHSHSSPNSGIPEAAMAGALGVQLGGPATYGGMIIEKPYIGEDSSTWLKMAQNSSKTDDETDYIQAESAVLIVKAASILGLCTALFIIYIKELLQTQF